MQAITTVSARDILDSRGQPTVEAEVTCHAEAAGEGGWCGRAAVREMGGEIFFRLASRSFSV